MLLPFLFTLSDHFNCIQMPIDRFLYHPERQFSHQLCNIGFGRGSRLKGKVVILVCLTAFRVDLYSIAESRNKITSILCLLSHSVSSRVLLMHVWVLTK